MMKRTLKLILPALCTAAICLGGTLSASAYTADDVAAKARAAGWPENVIQSGYNEWASGEYTQEQLDRAYESVMQYDEDSAEMIREALGVSVDPSPAPAATTNPPESAANTPSPAPQDQGSPAETNAPSPAAPKTDPAPGAPITVTKTDGTSEERVTKADFIQMTIEEKKEYVASLTEESKKDFMNSLTTEERNSILKQLPADEKAALIQSYVDTAKDMGMNVAVDNIADNNISMTIRNEEGQVIGKTSVGTIIDETGISHTAQLMTAFLAALTAVFGFMMIYRYLSRLD